MEEEARFPGGFARCRGCGGWLQGLVDGLCDYCFKRREGPVSEEKAAYGAEVHNNPSRDPAGRALAQYGMTVWDEFFKAAIVGLLAAGPEPGHENLTAQDLASASALMADSMCAERAKR